MQNIKVLAEDFADNIWRRSGQLDLTTIVEDLLYEKGFAVEDPLVADNFDKLKRAVSKRLSRKIEEAHSKGLKPRYIFTDVDPDYLKPLSNIAEDKIKDDAIEAIRALSWRAFEYFVCHMLTINGVKSSAARGTKEEGIDIFGLLNLRDVSPATLWHNATLRIAGQAKTGKIAEPMVRLFCTDLDSLRQKKGRAYDQSPDWFKKSTAPIIGIMFTSAKIAGTAAKWATDKGILTRDIRQMVEDLLTAPNCTPGLSQGENHLLFDKAEFISSFENKR